MVRYKPKENSKKPYSNLGRSLEEAWRKLKPL